MKKLLLPIVAAIALSSSWAQARVPQNDSDFCHGLYVAAHDIMMDRQSGVKKQVWVDKMTDLYHRLSPEAKTKASEFALSTVVAMHLVAVDQAYDDYPQATSLMDKRKMAKRFAALHHANCIKYLGDLRK